MTIKLVFLFVLLYLASTCKAEEEGTINYSVCDDGVANVENDLLSKDGDCNGQKIVLHKYYQPAGESYCQDSTNTVNGKPLCMNDTILYDALLPISGDYRPLPPKYGEYDYLPPQRWMHALKYGAVVFLYHPCAPLEQIMELKRLARSCLWKHIITPSSHLSRDKPFALVSFGCKYIMSWVDWVPAVEWIKQHSLQTAESVVIEDGLYTHGLIEPSYVVSTVDDSIVCPTKDKDGKPKPVDTMNNITDEPQLNNTETTTTTITNTSDNDVVHNNSNCNTSSDDQFVCHHHNYIIITLHNYPILYGAIALMAVTILTLTVFLLCLCSSRNPLCCLFRGRSKKRPLGRYKPCGQFYKGNSAGSIVGIAIPELGVPKTVPSEREKLLLESDEDDL